MKIKKPFGVAFLVTSFFVAGYSLPLQPEPAQAAPRIAPSQMALTSAAQYDNPCDPGTIGNCTSLERENDWCNKSSCGQNCGSLGCCHSYFWWCDAPSARYYLSADCNGGCSLNTN